MNTLRLTLGRVLLFGTLAAVLLPGAAFAQNKSSTEILLQKQLQEAGEDGAGYAKSGRTDPLGFVTMILKVFMSLLGIIFLTLTVYGGYLWMMARGNEAEVEKAKETIKAGVIGMGIILAAYIISINVLHAILRATGRVAGPLI